VNTAKEQTLKQASTCIRPTLYRIEKGNKFFN